MGVTMAALNSTGKGTARIAADDLDNNGSDLVQPASAVALDSDFAALLAQCQDEEVACIRDFGADVSAAFPSQEFRAWQVAEIRWADAFGVALANPSDEVAAAALTHADRVLTAARNHLWATRGWEE